MSDGGTVYVAMKGGSAKAFDWWLLIAGGLDHLGETEREEVREQIGEADSEWDVKLDISVTAGKQIRDGLAEEYFEDDWVAEKIGSEELALFVKQFDRAIPE